MQRLDLNLKCLTLCCEEYSSSLSLIIYAVWQNVYTISSCHMFIDFSCAPLPFDSAPSFETLGPAAATSDPSNDLNAIPLFIKLILA